MPSRGEKKKNEERLLRVRNITVAGCWVYVPVYQLELNATTGWKEYLGLQYFVELETYSGYYHSGRIAGLRSGSCSRTELGVRSATSRSICCGLRQPASRSRRRLAGFLGRVIGVAACPAGIGVPNGPVHVGLVGDDAQCYVLGKGTKQYENEPVEEGGKLQKKKKKKKSPRRSAPMPPHAARSARLWPRPTSLLRARAGRPIGRSGAAREQPDDGSASSCALCSPQRPPPAPRTCCPVLVMDHDGFRHVAHAPSRTRTRQHHSGSSE